MRVMDKGVKASETKIYRAAIAAINKAKIPFLVGGGQALSYYTATARQFHDLDLFCKAGDYPRILQVLAKEGFKARVEDEKWLAKATRGKWQIDLLFSTTNGVHIVGDSWLKHGRPSKVFGEPVNILGAEDLFWSKIYVQNSGRYDGADLNHLILGYGDKLDWHGILRRLETHWELLFSALINYRFVYPSERAKIPDWLIEELSKRLKLQMSSPRPEKPVCRGLIIARDDYIDDVKKGGFIV